jgi:hypothetical protein
VLEFDPWMVFANYKKQWVTFEDEIYPNGK